MMRGGEVTTTVATTGVQVVVAVAVAVSTTVVAEGEAVGVGVKVKVGDGVAVAVSVGVSTVGVGVSWACTPDTTPTSKNTMPAYTSRFTAHTLRVHAVPVVARVSRWSCLLL